MSLVLTGTSGASTLDSTNGLQFATWTTGTRPASPIVGQMGYNTTTGQFDAYTSNGWVSVASSNASTGTAMTLISSQTASNSATIDFTSISNTTFTNYRLVGYNIFPVNNGVNLYLQVSVNGTFQTGASAYRDVQLRYITTSSSPSGGVSSAIRVNSPGDTMANAANSGTQGGLVFDMTFYNCSQTNTVKRCTYHTSYYGSDYLDMIGTGTYLTAADTIDGFRFSFSGGNISTGTFILYGIK